MLATSDLPGGAVNLLPGHTDELAPRARRAHGRQRVDVTGVAVDQRHELERAAAGNVKRVLPAPAYEPDWSADPGTGRLVAPLEIKTVWHPVGT